MTGVGVDPRRCPVCGDANACGVVEGAGSCWCFSTPVPPEVLAKVPAQARDRACVCRTCATGGPSAAQRIEQARDLLRKR